MSFIKLFSANLKILLRNWRGLFWNIILPVGLYIGLSVLKIPSLGVTGAYSYYLLPGIVAMTIMQTGIFSLAYWLIELRERGVIKRFRVTPLSNTEFIGSLIATRLLVMIIQVILISAVGRAIFSRNDSRQRAWHSAVYAYRRNAVP